MAIFKARALSNVVATAKRTHSSSVTRKCLKVLVCFCAGGDFFSRLLLRTLALKLGPKVVSLSKVSAGVFQVMSIGKLYLQQMIRSLTKSEGVGVWFHLLAFFVGKRVEFVVSHIVQDLGGHHTFQELLVGA